MLLLLVVAFARLCDAIKFTSSNWDVRPGEKFHITWTDQVEFGTINLLRGRPDQSDQTQFPATLVICEFSTAGIGAIFGSISNMEFSILRK